MQMVESGYNFERDNRRADGYVGEKRRHARKVCLPVYPRWQRSKPVPDRKAERSVTRNIRFGAEWTPRILLGTPTALAVDG